MDEKENTMNEKENEWMDTILGRLHVPTFKKLYNKYKNIGELINGD